MKTNPRNRLIGLNRVLVFCLTLGGLLMNGFRIADLLCTLAVCLWLWMPQCSQREAQLLRWIAHRRGAANRQHTFIN